MDIKTVQMNKINSSNEQKKKSKWTKKNSLNEQKNSLKINKNNSNEQKIV